MSSIFYVLGFFCAEIVLYGLATLLGICMVVYVLYIISIYFSNCLFIFIPLGLSATILCQFLFVSIGTADALVPNRDISCAIADLSSARYEKKKFNFFSIAYFG